MRDLHLKKQRPAPQNRLKKPPKERKPVNYRLLMQRLGKFAGGVTLCLLIGFGGQKLAKLVVNTTFMRLSKIEVVNLKRLGRDEVITLAGIKPGDAMLGLRLRRIGEQLVKNPWIEQVKVRRYFPGTLIIEVTEREPVAVINMGYLYYLDKKGEVFKPLTEGDRLDFPVVTGINEEDIGKDPVGSRIALKATVELLATLKAGTGFKLDDISEIHYDRGYGFTLFTAGFGVPLKLGNAGFNDKLARLAKIYTAIQAELATVEYIDLDFNDKIIVKKG
jgi:cell division protein FtsQ